MNRAEQMTAAYLEAVAFTEDRLGELTALFKAQAANVCSNLARVYPDIPAEQAGHDLWLTRNGHGAGFWDRARIYGTHDASELTRLAEVLGPHDAEYEPCPDNVVIVTVRGGLAEPAVWPDGIDVRIVDFDNPPSDRDTEAEGWL